MKDLFGRMIRAGRLDAKTYKDVEMDRSSTAGAVVIVLVASVAAALGAGVRDVAGIISAVAVLVITWILWVLLTWLIGTRVLPGPATHSNIGEVLRATGYSASPGILRVLGAIPLVGLPIYIGVTFWMLVTFVVAIRQAMDYSGLARAVAVCILGWLIHGFLFFAFVRMAI
jgi:hypothetical protein